MFDPSYFSECIVISPAVSTQVVYSEISSRVATIKCLPRFPSIIMIFFAIGVAMVQIIVQKQ